MLLCVCLPVCVAEAVCCFVSFCFVLWPVAGVAAQKTTAPFVVAVLNMSYGKDPQVLYRKGGFRVNLRLERQIAFERHAISQVFPSDSLNLPDSRLVFLGKFDRNSRGQAVFSFSLLL